MNEARLLPALIGTTQYAMNRLVTKTLSGTRIPGHDPWVYLNVAAEANGGDAVLGRAAQALHQPVDAARVVRAQLIAGGLLDQDDLLTPTGTEVLQEGRGVVAGVVSQLTEGIESESLRVTAGVLTTMRERAEAQLSA